MQFVTSKKLSLVALVVTLVAGCGGELTSRGDGGAAPMDAAPTDAGAGRDTGTLPSGEDCDNGLDDDRDTFVDEDCDCTLDAVAPCFGGDPSQADVGACTYGEHRCQPRGEFQRWSACQGGTLPSEETCGDAVDDDCDGSVDEGCTGCTEGETRSCYSGPAATEGVGTCVGGTQTCEGGGWSSCVGDVTPVAESCAGGLDEDCDGAADCADTDCDSGSGCCMPSCGARACGDDGCGGSCGTCAGELSCLSGTCACASGTACGSSCCTGGTRCADDSHCVLNYYCPLSELTRRQLAVFAIRIADGTSASPTPGRGFSDFPPGALTPFAEEAVRRGIMGLCGADQFCPNAAVERIQIAEILIKAMRGSSFTPPACRGLFSDLSCADYETRYAEALADAGVTNGCTATTFCPDRRVVRQNAAAFVWRAYRWARGDRPAPSAASPAIRDVFLDTSSAGPIFRDFIDESGLIRLSNGAGSAPSACEYTGQPPVP